MRGARDTGCLTRVQGLVSQALIFSSHYPDLTGGEPRGPTGGAVSGLQ